jgi:hypothetical protein
MTNDPLSNFNPLRGLDLYGLVNYLELGERGYYRDPMWLFRYVLKRNGVARAVRRKLASAIQKLDWSIKIPDDLDDARKALADRQQAELRKAYDAVSNLRAAYTHLGLTDIMGFAHLNKVYAGSQAGAGADPWLVTELRVVEQWWMCRDGLFGAWNYNPSLAMTNRGDLIVPRDWIFREVDDPAAEIFAFAHVKITTTDADWDQFCDTYAVPPIFIEGPPNARKEDEPHYQDVAERVVSDGRGYLPSGAKPHSITAGTDGVSVFVERLRYYREEIVLAGTGGILTTLSGEGAFGQGGAADNHDDAWLDIAAAAALGVSETLQAQFDAAVLARKFPGEERLAYFELAKPERDTDATTIFTFAKAAADAGFDLDAEELAEKTGLKVTRSAAPVAPAAAPGAPANPISDTKPTVEAPTTQTGAAAPPATPQPPTEQPAAPAAPSIPPTSARGEADDGLVQAALANDLGVEERWLAPVAHVFDEIEAMLADPNATLEQITAKLEEATKAMPELLGQLNVGELAHALENASGPAAIQGLADGLRAKTQKATS